MGVNINFSNCTQFIHYFSECQAHINEVMCPVTETDWQITTFKNLILFIYTYNLSNKNKSRETTMKLWNYLTPELSNDILWNSLSISDTVKACFTKHNTLLIAVKTKISKIFWYIVTPTGNNSPKFVNTDILMEIVFQLFFKRYWQITSATVVT